MKRILIIFWAVLLGVTVASAQKFAVRVVGISDGDTFTVINQDKLQLKIRIFGIDAPEKGQDFGNKAKQALSDFIMGKVIQIDVQSKDSWGRLISYVYTPEGRDVSLLMLQEGMAWHFVKYDDTEKYARAEAKARTKKKGLWSQPNPIAPWDYRSGKRRK